MARPLKRVTKTELRELFNDGCYWERAQAGEFTERIAREDEIRERKRKKLGMAAGSRSQLIEYIDGAGKVVARVHQYVKPNGEIRTDTRPDPKWLLIDGLIHAPHPEPPPECRRKGRL